MPPTFRSHRQPSVAEVKRAADRRRGSARARGYTSKWDKAAKSYLSRHPLCLYCELGAFGDAPRTTAADCVDHIIPHKGDQARFWDTSNWAPSCQPCHDGPKQSVERRPAALTALANAVRAHRAR
jgi:5-methylcytosine-specific restriction endonuclease McrA